MNTSFLKKIKLVVLMLSMLVTVPFYNISANGSQEERQSIKTLFPNPSTTIAVVNGFKQANPSIKGVSENYEISNKELNTIEKIQYTFGNPIKFFDKDLDKLKKLSSISYINPEIESLDGIEIMGDRLTYLSLGYGVIQDIEPVKALVKLETFTINNPTAITNQMVESNPKFLEPLEKLPLTRFTSNRVAFNDHHAESISKIQSLKYVILENGKVTDFSNFGKLENVETLDLSDNNFSNLAGFEKLGNIRTLYIDNINGARDKNRVYDFSGLVYPTTFKGVEVKTLNFQNNRVYLPLSIEYLETSPGEYTPLYYFKLDRIINPTSTSPGHDFVKNITLNNHSKYVDTEKNRIILDNDAVESKILNCETGEIKFTDFSAGDLHFGFGNYKSIHDGAIEIYMGSYEIIGDLPPSKKVNVELIYNNNQPNGNVEVNRNEPMSEPETPKYDNNVFVGWYSEPTLNEKWDFNNPVIEDMSLYAKWEFPVEDKYYNVNFETYGGSIINTKKVIKDSKVIVPVEPSKDGYTFKGWYTDQSFNKVYDFDLPVTEDLTLHAKFDKMPVYYDFNFDTQGGSDIDKLSVLENTVVTKPLDPIKFGYIFKGWYIDTEFTTEYDFLNVVTEDTTIYAKWERKSIYYIFSFNTMGGSEIESKNVLENTYPRIPKDPVKNGHIFRGWHVDIDLSKLHDFKTFVTENITVYAKWEKVPETYRVSFDTQGGSLVADQLVIENTSAIEPTEPIKAGYNFLGWYLGSSDDMFNFDTKIQENTILVAKWAEDIKEEQITYDFKFDSLDGTDVINIKVEENDKVRVPAEPTKEGYYFVGWFEDLIGNVSFDFDSPITRDITVYAKWNVKPDQTEVIILEFDTQGGTEVETQYVIKGEFPFEPEQPVKHGHTFEGWYDDSDCTIEHSFDEHLVEDKVVFAKWEKVNEENPKEEKPKDKLPKDEIPNKELPKDKNVLPSTGVSDESLIMVASILIVMGMVVVIINRKKEQ